jgi:uncharacterized membrane-anchored protein
MKKIINSLIVLNLALVSLYIVYATYQKEQIISKGELILLRLAPVDPRSLMQGDYMILNYAINSNIPDSIPNKGYLIFEKDSTGNLYPKKIIKKLNAEHHQVAIKYQYKANDWQAPIKIGAESYFFEEGQAQKFDQAKYGGLKVDTEGNSILIGLYDINRQLIK